MTYCLAMRLDEGLVFLSDTRTNAGLDNVNTFRKQHVLCPASDRVFVLESAGSLATTHQVLDLIERDLSLPGDHESLATVTRLFEAALYIGRLSRQVAIEHGAALGPDGSATFSLGGQIAGQRPDVVLVYPEGNYIRASDERPFLQIGETKNGRFMLELAVETHVELEAAAKIALTSMMMTARANLSVGPPYDLAVYRNGSLAVEELRIASDAPFLEELDAVWARHLEDAIHDLPAVAAEALEA